MTPALQLFLFLTLPPAIGFLIAPLLKRRDDARRARQRAEDAVFFNRNRKDPNA